MESMLLDVKTLPEPLFKLFHTEKVRVTEVRGEVHLMPVRDTGGTSPLYEQPHNNKRAVDEFMVNERAEYLASLDGLRGSIDDPTFTEPADIPLNFNTPREGFA
jgi:hypothetical protein